MTGTGRGWAYLGAILGGSVSVAANIAHCYIRPDGAPQEWAPQTGAVALSALWPVMVLVAVEILGRVAWPAGWRWWSLRWGGLTPVTTVAAIVSYRHLSGLLASYGEDSIVSVIGPLAIDGLMVISSAALLSMSVETDPRTGPDRLSGHADSVSAESDRPGQQARTAVEMESAERPLDGSTSPEPVRLPDAHTACPPLSGLRDPYPVDGRTPDPDIPPVTCGDTGTDTDSTSASSTAPDTPSTAPGPDTRTGPDSLPAPAVRRAGQARTGGVRDQVWALHTRYPEMTMAEIARQVDVTERTVRRHLAAMPDSTSAPADRTSELVDTSV